MENNENLVTASPSSTIQVNSDWFLQLLVDTCNHSEFSISITLNVGGVLVSGELIGGEKYFAGFASDLKEAGLSIEIVDSFNKLGDIYGKQGEQVEHDKSTQPPQYIHLKNARIFHPGGNPIPMNRGVWWRGRLEAIDGFILGSLSVDK
ncbi:MAG: gas vesicle accessory protein GvpU [Bellilinea sp.]